MRTKALALVILALPTACTLAREDERAIVEGVLARADAVFSASFEYEAFHGLERNKAAREPWIASISGSDWSRTSLVTKGKSVCKGGRMISFRGTTQSNGTTRFDAQVDDLLPIEKWISRPPSMVGTFWDPHPKNYVRQHMDRVRVVGDSEVDGIKVIVLEWDVPPEDLGRAFYSFPQEVLATKDKKLRLYVAPQLGFVMPRYEYIGDGSVFKDVVSADFEKVGNGIWLPRRSKKSSYSKPGPPFVEEFTITKVNRVNEPIPDSEFTIDLPFGTYVSDKRNKPAARMAPFEVRKQTIYPAEVSDILSPGKGPSYRRWYVAIGLGAVLGFLISLGLYWRRRRGKQGPA